MHGSLFRSFNTHEATHERRFAFSVLEETETAAADLNIGSSDRGHLIQCGSSLLLTATIFVVIH